jgi:hypothetical protein
MSSVTNPLIFIYQCVFTFPSFFLRFSFFKFFKMKRLIFLFVLSFNLCPSKTLENFVNSNSLAASAIKVIIDEYFSLHDHKIDVINFGSNHGAGEKILTTIFKFENQSIAIINKKCARNSNKKIRLSSSSILIFDSPENFKLHAGFIDWQQHSTKLLRHLVYIHQGQIDDVKVLNNTDLSIDQVNFLVNETRDSIELVTAFMFGPNECWKNRFKVVNKFTRTNMRWKTLTFYKEKLKNLHGCPIRQKFQDQNKHKIDSIFQDVLSFKFDSSNSTQLALSFHFKIESKNFTKIVNNYVLDLNPEVIMIPPGELYGIYEKLFVAFDLHTWTAILATLFTMFSGAIIIKLLPSKIQTMLTGRFRRTCVINFISVLLMGNQHRFVHKTSSRLLLISVLIWSLVIR